MSRTLKIVIVLHMIGAILFLAAIFPGVIKPALSKERSTIHVSIVDNKDNPVPNAKLVFYENGFRYLFPIPFISPAWHSSKKYSEYFTSKEGGCEIVFFDERANLEYLIINEISIPSKIEAIHKDSESKVFYTYEYISWWTDSQNQTRVATPRISQHDSNVSVTRGYIQRTILGHEVKIILHQ